MAAFHALLSPSPLSDEYRIQWKTQRRGPKGTTAAQPLLIAHPFSRPIPIPALEDQNPYLSLTTLESSTEADTNSMSAFEALRQLLGLLKPGDGIPAQLPINLYVPYSGTMALAVLHLRVGFPDVRAATTTPLDRFVRLIGHTLSTTAGVLPPYGKRPLESVVGETCYAHHAATGEYFQCEHISMNLPDTQVCLSCPGKGITLSKRICADPKFIGTGFNVKSLGHTVIDLAETKEVFKCATGPNVSVKILRSLIEFVGEMTFEFSGGLKALITFVPKPLIGGNVGAFTGEVRNGDTIVGHLSGICAEGGYVNFNGVKLCDIVKEAIPDGWERLKIGRGSDVEGTHAARIWRGCCSAIANNKYGKAQIVRKAIDKIAEKEAAKFESPVYFRRVPEEVYGLSNVYRHVAWGEPTLYNATPVR